MLLPQNNEAVSQPWTCLITLRLPHNNKDTWQQLCCLITMRLTHNNEAATYKWGYLTTMRLHHNNEAASQQWGCLITMRLLHDIGATAQQRWLITKKLSSTNIAKITKIKLHHNWGFLTTLSLTNNIWMDCITRMTNEAASQSWLRTMRLFPR